jgi:predicted nucleic acid-binding protein
MILFLDTNIVIYAVENPAVLEPKANACLTAWGIHDFS